MGEIKTRHLAGDKEAIMNTLSNTAETLKNNIGDFSGEWLNVHSNADVDGYPVKNPMVYTNAEDQMNALEELAKIIDSDDSVAIFGSGYRMW